MKYKIVTENSNRFIKFDTVRDRELYIFPEDEYVENRNFNWRISITDFDGEATAIGPVYGFRRWLMPLDKQVNFQTESGSHSEIFEPNTTHYLKGEWNGIFVGPAKCVQLVLAENIHGIIKSVEISKDDETTIASAFQEIFDDRLQVYNRQLFVGVYSNKMDIEIIHSEGLFFLKQNELWLVEYTSKEENDIGHFILKQNSGTSGKLSLFFVTVPRENQ